MRTTCERQPLVSCVMPTRNRAAFLQRAMGCFGQQTHAPSELVVVDDGDEAVEHLCGGPSVRYLRVRGRMSLGSKMNFGIEHAAGDYIVKWDDDDWYHPEFIRTMIDALLGSANPDEALAACGRYLVFLAGGRILRVTRSGLTAGGTFTFSKLLWRRAPFRDIGVEEDYWFRTDTGAKVAPVDRLGLYVVVRHGGNTWVRSRDGQRVINRVLASLPEASVRPADLFSPEELAFYLSLPSLEQAGETFRDVRGAIAEP